MKITDIISDEELKKVFDKIKYRSPVVPRDKVIALCLRVACSYGMGKESNRILEDLGLKQKRKNFLSEKGKDYLYFAFIKIM